MAVTASLYGSGMKKIMQGLVDPDSDTFKATLHTSAYAPNQDTDDFFDDATNELPTAGGYTAGGVALTALSVTYDAATNEVRWDFADPTWTSASFTARRMVVRKARGGLASADELVLWVDFGGDEAIVSGTFSVVLPATGIAKVTVS